jgi:putative lysine transport system permease protein
MSSNLPSDFLGRIIYLITNFSGSFLRGAATTLIIAVVSTAIGCLIGFIVGIIQTIPVNSNDSVIKRVLLKIVNIILKIYVEVFRGTPMMVQAMFIYYGAAMYLNLHMDMWSAAFIIVSINTGAYMAETVRGGIISVDEGQTEGAKAIGMTHYQTMLYIVFPQTLRNIIPQIGNNLIINIKDSSVLCVIGVVELFFSAKQTAGAYYWFFESMSIAMVVYLVMTLITSFLLRKWEKKLDGSANFDLATTDTLAHTSGLMHGPEMKRRV